MVGYIEGDVPCVKTKRRWQTATAPCEDSQKERKIINWERVPMFLVLDPPITNMCPVAISNSNRVALCNYKSCPNL